MLIINIFEFKKNRKSNQSSIVNVLFYSNFQAKVLEN